jgi:Leucine-rich repeat (LRR) protein
VLGQGGIPEEIGNLKSLIMLSLGGNQLEGEKHVHLQWCPQIMNLIGAGQIPKEIGNLKSLQILGLQGNQLEGTIGGNHQ